MTKGFRERNEDVEIDIALNPRCGCGSESVGWLVHSDWCPVYVDPDYVGKKKSAMRFWSGVTKSWVHIDSVGKIIPQAQVDDDAT